MQFSYTKIYTTSFIIFAVFIQQSWSILLKLYALESGAKSLRQADAFDNSLDFSGESWSDSLFAHRVNTVLGAFFNTAGQLVGGTKSMREEVTFWCSTVNHPNYKQVFVNDLLLNYKLNSSNPIAFIAHGWTDNVNRSWVKRTVADYLKFKGGNVCAVDWNRLALTEYNLAASYTAKVGSYLGTFIRFLLLNGFDIKKVTLIGHSMGAHIAGIAGHALGGKVERLIGLDPAGPAFTKPFMVEEKKRLDPSDAVFVQAIHTDKNIIGTTQNVGHQDYYPNGGGNPQPGCEFPLVNNDTTKAYLQFICSHFKAVEYFRASLNPSNQFRGILCSSYTNYKKGACKSNVGDLFGVYAKNIINGPVFLQIDSAAYPYVDARSSSGQF